jgi:hypothetical protein
MTHEIETLSKPRALSHAERELTAWLLSHSDDYAREFLAQLELAEVATHCSTCPSIDFSIAGQQPQSIGLHPLSDFYWRDARGCLFGVTVFAQDGLLACLDVWSIDGLGDAIALPAIESLKPLVEGPL